MLDYYRTGDEVELGQVQPFQFVHEKKVCSHTDIYRQPNLRTDTPGINNRNFMV